MLVIPGSPAHSAPRLAALQSPGIAIIASTWLYLVQPKSPAKALELLDPEHSSRKTLSKLLEPTDVEFSAAGSIYVLPRPGSVTPWSSKATDIAHLCGLAEHVDRIERGIVYSIKSDAPLTNELLDTIKHRIHDRMTQAVHRALPAAEDVFFKSPPRPLRSVQLSTLKQANIDLGLALSNEEIDYLVTSYESSSRQPTDAELFMFAQVNSEHCRHKIFNASWDIDSRPRDMSLFQMIRNTEKVTAGGNTISAYSDNAAVFSSGYTASKFGVDAKANEFISATEEEEHLILIKAETHNHPTAISPFPGAATGSGGEIRDEGAVGRGSQPKAGITGYTVSNLLIPGFVQPWEEPFTQLGRPSHVASSLDIMLEGPLGGSGFNNEFGRPCIGGYFRTFCQTVGDQVWGYHKPLMIAGGYGTVKPKFAVKTPAISAGAHVIVLGGPGLLIGLGGGAASSQASGTGSGSAELDYVSVQRDNPEMERRCQQVINACTSLPSNPIESIHDVGAGGLSNALPELVHDSGLGGRFELRDVPVADSGMSPMEIWCNESQERYVIAVSPIPGALEVFEAIAKRERCPYGVVGVATKEEELVVTDRLLGDDVIHLKMAILFGKPPRMHRVDSTASRGLKPFDITNISSGAITDSMQQAVGRVLRLPAVGSKSFLITIGDRSVTGLVARDQMVGPFQAPVADVGVTKATYSFDDPYGEAVAMGERTPLALISAAASARMAVAESLLNLNAAHVGALSKVKLSANWMSAASMAGEGASMYEAVKAVGMDLCPKLGVGIPVGKDSMSMAMKWKEPDSGMAKAVTSPLSLIVTAFAGVQAVHNTWTPEIRVHDEPTILVFFDLAQGKMRLGGSALAQVFLNIGDDAPDVEDAQGLKAFFEACQAIRTAHPDLILAYHDRSDGGLFVTLAEMSFAGHVGVHVTLPCEEELIIPFLFNEELGAVVQIRASEKDTLWSFFTASGVPMYEIGRVGSEIFRVQHNSSTVFSSPFSKLQEIWAETSFQMQSLRDDAACAKEEFSLISDTSYSGLAYELTFTPAPSAPLAGPKPRVAIVREQGVNSQVEMAWSFTVAGFSAVDVHMSDILNGTVSLATFRGLAFPGGFSYGDVFGAGKGWANSVLLNPIALEEFSNFFARPDTFAFGACNGCQFLSHLARHGVIPGAQDWPEFTRNKSERFEARVSMVKVMDTPATRSSVFLREMVGSRLPISVAHGEGRASFGNEQELQSLEANGLVGVRFIDAAGEPTERYPLNPNGSPRGITGVQTPDGRVFALMPHPERVTSLVSNSWYPKERRAEWSGVGPWFKLFQSARAWCVE